MPHPQQLMATGRGQRKMRLGTVVRNKMAKTISVQVVQLFRHPKYDRVIRRASTFKAHDETNSASIGDWVSIMETRPLSKEKRWRLVEIVKRASSAPPLPQEEVLATPERGAPNSPEARGATPASPRADGEPSAPPKRAKPQK